MKNEQKTKIDRLSQFLISSQFIWIIIGIGSALRLVHYFHNCSLSIDESSLALNIIDRNYSELFKPLDYNQGAPIFFLLVQKFLTLSLNANELTLRLVPLISGIVSLILFYKLARNILSPNAIPVAVGLFAISDTLIFYSAQVKQYSSDVMLVLLIYLVTHYIRSVKLTVGRVLLFGILGALAIWFSQPSIFVLTAIGSGLCYFNIWRGKRDKRWLLTISFICWIAGFVSVYLISLRNLGHHDFLMEYWSDSFMPFPPASTSDVRWYVVNFFKLFSKTLGYSLPGVGGLTFILGSYSLMCKCKTKALDLLLPIVLVLIASGFHKYPFSGRLILFLSPAIILLMAEGVDFIRESTKNNLIIMIAISTLLFIHPILWAGYYVIQPRFEEEIKPVLKFLKEHRKTDDIIYLYYRSEIAFTYYANRYDFDKERCVIGIPSKPDWNGYRKDLQQLQGNKRVWIVFSHIYNWEDIDDERLFLYYLDTMGKRLSSFKSFGASVYLYDLELGIKKK